MPGSFMFVKLLPGGSGIDRLEGVGHMNGAGRDGVGIVGSAGKRRLPRT